MYKNAYETDCINYIFFYFRFRASHLFPFLLLFSFSLRAAAAACSFLTASSSIRGLRPASASVDHGSVSLVMSQFSSSSSSFSQLFSRPKIFQFLSAVCFTCLESWLYFIGFWQLDFVAGFSLSRYCRGELQVNWFFLFSLSRYWFFVTPLLVLSFHKSQVHLCFGNLPIPFSKSIFSVYANSGENVVLKYHLKSTILRWN